MAIIGYARVSTSEQNLDLQRNALMQAECDHIFEDNGISATADHRAGFEAALNRLEAGDIFVVWKMDRAFRSLKNALTVLEQFEARGIEFRCLTEAIDTTTPMGKCMYQIRNAFAELERNFIRERTIAGIEAARKRGSKIGRPMKLSRKQINQIKKELKINPALSRTKLASSLGVSTKTLSRALKTEC